MKTSILLNNFSKARFNHYSKEKLDSISNKYVRVLYAIYVIIKDTIRYDIPKSLKYIYKVLLAIPLLLIDILDNILESIHLWYFFIKIAYYWDKIEENNVYEKTYSNVKGGEEVYDKKDMLYRE